MWLLASMHREDGQVAIDGFEDRSTPGSTLNVNALETGGGGVGARTVIPSKVTAFCDMWLGAGQRSSEVVELIRQHVARRVPSV